MNIKEFIKICIEEDIPVDYEIKFSIGLALYDLDEYTIGNGNRRIIFREVKEEKPCLMRKCKS